jgi:general secretion pathway protein B
MSYILDAIAKSEAERQQQEMPRAEGLALFASASPKSSQLWLYSIAGALLLNALVLAIWLRPGPEAPATIESAGAMSDETSVAAENDGIAPISTNPVSIRGTSANDTKVVTEISIQADPQNVAVIGKSTATASSEQRRNESTLVPDRHKTSPPINPITPSMDERGGETALSDVDIGEVNRGDSNHAEVAETNPTVSNDDEGWLRVEPDSLTLAIDAGQRPIPISDTGGDESLYYRVSNLSDLPDAVRKDLPTLTFSGHLYSSNPQSRLVFVGDGRPIITGQQIAEELFLHEITPSGVVVEFKGYLIEVGILQNWTLN